MGPVALLSDGRSPSGMHKSTAQEALRLSGTGPHGDAQAALRSHGGPETAVHPYPHEPHAYWSAWSGRADLLRCPGASGENLSTAGWEKSNACIGDGVRLGEALGQVPQGRPPGWKLDVRFGETGMARQMQARSHTGWY